MLYQLIAIALKVPVRASSRRRSIHCNRQAKINHNYVEIVVMGERASTSYIAGVLNIVAARLEVHRHCARDIGVILNEKYSQRRDGLTVDRSATVIRTPPAEPLVCSHSILCARSSRIAAEGVDSCNSLSVRLCRVSPTPSARQSQPPEHCSTATGIDGSATIAAC